MITRRPPTRLTSDCQRYNLSQLNFMRSRSRSMAFARIGKAVVGKNTVEEYLFLSEFGSACESVPLLLPPLLSGAPLRSLLVLASFCELFKFLPSGSVEASRDALLLLLSSRTLRSLRQRQKGGQVRAKHDVRPTSMRLGILQLCMGCNSLKRSVRPCVQASTRACRGGKAQHCMPSTALPRSLRL